MNVQANNIANVNTCGFKAEKPAFQALMYGMVNGIGGDQLPKGSGTRMVSTATDFSQAPVEETGRKQDYAIAGDGFFALFDPSKNEISFTRDGSFAAAGFQEQDEEGEWHEVYYLTDGAGRQVLNSSGYPIQMENFEEEQPGGRVYRAIPGWTAAPGRRALPGNGKKRKCLDGQFSSPAGIFRDIQHGSGH